MTQERIDLTQFEGTIAEGKWDEYIHEPKEDGYERVASVMVSGVIAPPYTLQTNEGHTFATVEMGDLTAHLPLFRMAPDLIAELKRMYKREDELIEILSILEDRHDIDMSQFDSEEIHPKSLREQDFAQGNGELESTYGDGQPEWNSGPNM